MDNFKIEITSRPNGPDSKLHNLREEGYIPGILYGFESSNQLIQLKAKEIQKHLKEHGESSIFNVEFGDEIIPVKMNEIQKDIISQELIHVDLQRIEINKEVEMAIPIQLIGQAAGVQNGGTIQQQLRTIKVRSLPSLMPESIIVDISSFDIGHNLYVKDINIPEGTKILNNDSTLMLTILPPENQMNNPNEQLPSLEPEIIIKDKKNTDIE